MKEDDLMIGDYVFCCGILKVEEIRMNFITIIDDDSIIIEEIGKIRPIPLTGTMILNSGFKEDEINKNYKQYVMGLGDYRLFIDGFSNSECKYWHCHIDNSKYESVGGGDLQYVHELQNLIRVITGKELDFKFS